MSTALAPFQSQAADLVIGSGLPSLIQKAEQLEQAWAKLEGLDVQGEDEAKAVNQIIALAKMAHDAIESDRTERKKPILKDGRELDAFYAPSKALFEKIVKQAKSKLNLYLAAKQEKAALALAAAATKVDEATKQRDEALAAGDPKAVSEATNALIEARREKPLESFPTKVRSSMAASSQYFKPAVKITSLKDVPRNFLESALLEEADLDGRIKCLEKILLAFQKAGQVPDGGIPGVDFYEEPVIVTRVGLQ